MTTKEKDFDCIKFKRELHENVLKISGAKNIDEYIDYVNEVAVNSPLYKTASAN
ncbi:MAG: hypothetical protein LBQ83_06710 [Candidatus Margulisbacteria bacterium]|jgi:hypothetical protein|nr:hypothetical protein [Candidatus Margulisiibacteriota bacterium]